MKKVAGLFIVFAFVLAASVLKLHAQAVHAQEAFEGTITWTLTIPMLDDDRHPMIINVKGDKTETDLDMGVRGDIKIYSDRSAKKMYMIMDTAKTAYVMDMSDNKTASADSIDIVPSGKKENIAGHPSEEYIVKGKKGDISIWFTADFPKDIQESVYYSLNNNPGQDPNESKAIMKFVKKGLVPVRVVAKIAGEVAMSMEFVNYERKSVGDALFVLPSDIKISPMPAGGGGMN